MKLDLVDAAGKKLDPIDVDDAVFGIEPNEAVVHQTLVAQLAARRSGTANTKTRSTVRGSTRKIRRQKGLGMARMGTNRSPIRRGGGVAFGPSQRSYVKKLPKRMRRLAIRSVLASRVAEERLTVIDSLGFDQPSTKVARAMLDALGVERSALIVTGDADRIALLSVRNVPGVSMTPADTLSVAEMLGHQNLILTVDAVRRIEALWGGERASGRGAPAPVAVQG
ncbi:MAG TPA: 50S ribosomal protein L4 [Dehalococcoidia bacterium]|jgi:large subunit ribosomal protein L4|nr:50S ribosomal protein L4 [Dehalococcoidia bacterium]